jgi:DNA invertase Pin-like site-specific DNA recombinase
MKKVRLKGVPEPVKVNKDGTIINYKGKPRAIHLTKASHRRQGYYTCSIAGKNFYVHHIVAEAYVPNKHPLVHKIVIHKNADSLDNHYTNLIWGNANELHKIRVKLGIPGAGVTKIDKKYRHTSSITYKQALKIAKRLDKGELAKDICKEYGVSEMSISRIRKRYCKQKQASPRYDKKIKKTVLKLAEKHPPGEVARITGIKYHTVYRWLKSQGSNTK